jgi:hypothetical protein
MQCLLKDKSGYSEYKCLRAEITHINRRIKTAEYNTVPDSVIVGTPAVSADACTELVILLNGWTVEARRHPMLLNGNVNKRTRNTGRACRISGPADLTTSSASSNGLA